MDEQAQVQVRLHADLPWKDFGPVQDRYDAEHVAAFLRLGQPNPAEQMVRVVEVVADGV